MFQGKITLKSSFSVFTGKNNIGPKFLHDNNCPEQKSRSIAQTLLEGPRALIFPGVPTTLLSPSIKASAIWHLPSHLYCYYLTVVGYFSVPMSFKKLFHLKISLVVLVYFCFIDRYQTQRKVCKSQVVHTLTYHKIDTNAYLPLR